MSELDEIITYGVSDGPTAGPSWNMFVRCLKLVFWGVVGLISGFVFFGVCPILSLIYIFGIVVGFCVGLYRIWSCKDFISTRDR